MAGPRHKRDHWRDKNRARLAAGTNRFPRANVLGYNEGYDTAGLLVAHPAFIAKHEPLMITQLRKRALLLGAIAVGLVLVALNWNTVRQGWYLVSGTSLDLASAQATSAVLP